MAWTKEQLAAMERDRGNMLVSAGAGSGKTAVLIQRIMGILTEGGVDVDRLLVLTYTNAAAAEMRQRLGSALREQLQQAGEAGAAAEAARLSRQLMLLPRAKIMTIHSFCLDLLREYSYALELDPKSHIGSEGELGLLRERVMDEVFEESYLEEESPLKLLLRHYSRGIGDEHIRGLVLRLLEFGQSMPDVEGWLAGLGDAYNIPENCINIPREAGGGPVAAVGPKEPGTAQGQWQRYFARLLQQELLEAAGVLAGAIRLAEDTAGLAPYLALLAVEEESVRTAAARLEQDFGQGLAAFCDISFGRLPGIRQKKDGPEIDMAAKERVKLLRSQVKDAIGRLRQEAAPLLDGTYWQELAELAPLAAALVELARRFYRAWQQAKRQRRLLEFADLEHYAIRLLADEQLGVARVLQERFYEILVDEYQDINQVQESLLELATNGHNRFMVGDIKQSIYRFRLAEPELFLRRFEAYGRGEGGCRVDLNRNFRSQAGVLAAVNFIFGQLMQGGDMEICYDEAAKLICGRPELPQLPVELLIIDKAAVRQGGAADGADNNDEGAQEDIEGGSGSGPDNGQDNGLDNGIDNGLSEADRWLAEMQTAELEARLLAAKIGEEIAGGRRPEDIVILLRAVKSWAPIISRALREQNIPCFAQGADDFVSLPEVQLVYNLLAVLDNPRQDIPLAALLHSPLVGLRLAELADLRILSRQLGDNNDDKRQGWLYEGVCASHDRRLVEFCGRLGVWRQKSRELGVAELLEFLYNATALPELLGALPGGALRRQSLRQLRRLAAEYDAGGGIGLGRFLRYLTAAGQRPLGEDEAATGGGSGGSSDGSSGGSSGGYVRVMTIHKSKGLEFPCVFVAGLGTAFNEEDLRQDILLHRSLGLGLRRVDLAGRRKLASFGFNMIARKNRWESLAESLRILYVAMTRAEHKLYLVGTAASAGALGRQLAGLGDGIGAGFLSRRRSFLPWVAACLLRHPDGGALRRLAEDCGLAGTKIRRELPGAEGNWHIEIIKSLPQLDPKGVEQAKKFDFGRWLNSPPRRPEQAAALREQVARALARQYPGAELARLAVKWSASSFKRLAPLSAEELAAGPEQEADRQEIAEEFREDLLAEAAKGADGALGDNIDNIDEKLKWYGEYGRLVHGILQRADLAELRWNPGQDYAAAHLRELLGRLGAGFDPTVAAAVRPRQLAEFFGGELGRRLLALPPEAAVLREQRFIAALTLRELAALDGEVWQRLSAECGGLSLERWGEEQLFLQGVIDLAFWEQGAWVLVDYKSGGNRGLSSQQVVKEHGLQLGIYRLALYKATGVMPKEGYIYFTANGRTVRLF